MHVLLMMGDGQGLLRELDLETLANDMLSSECLVGTVLDPMRQCRFLLELSDSCVALGKGRLVRTCL